MGRVKKGRVYIYTDITKPDIEAFEIPALSDSLIVPITTLIASDNVGVTKYMVTDYPTPPSKYAAGWGDAPPVSYKFEEEGVYTLYAWAMDAAGNISEAKYGVVVISFTP